MPSCVCCRKRSYATSAFLPFRPPVSRVGTLCDPLRALPSYPLPVCFPSTICCAWRTPPVGFRGPERCAWRWLASGHGAVWERAACGSLTDAHRCEGLGSRPRRRRSAGALTRCRKRRFGAATRACATSAGIRGGRPMRDRGARKTDLPMTYGGVRSGLWGRARPRFRATDGPFRRTASRPARSTAVRGSAGTR